MNILSEEDKESVADATTISRSRKVMVNLIENLPRLKNTVWAGNYRVPGSDVIVIAAGPSLDKNIHLLKEPHSSRVLVSVNTSAPACHKAGLQLHDVVVMESIDVSNQLPEAVPRILDLSSNPSNWHKSDELNAWFLPSGPVGSGIMHALQAGRSVPNAGNVSTAAVSIAHMWEPKRVCVIGQDLAYSDGKVYASGAQWGNLRYEEVDGKLQVEGHPERDELHLKHGVMPVPRKRKMYDVPGWNGGTVKTTHELAEQLEWYSKQTFPRPMYNCTEGGASIPGMQHVPLASFLATTEKSLYSQYSGERLVTHDIDSLKVCLERECEAVEGVTARMLDEKPYTWPTYGGACVTNVLAAADIITFGRMGLKMDQVMRGRYTALRRAAEMLREAIAKL